jgi:hypothetical protein
MSAQEEKVLTPEDRQVARRLAEDIMADADTRAQNGYVQRGGSAPVLARAFLAAEADLAAARQRAEEAERATEVLRQAAASVERTLWAEKAAKDAAEARAAALAGCSGGCACEVWTSRHEAAMALYDAKAAKDAAEAEVARLREYAEQLRDMLSGVLSYLGEGPGAPSMTPEEWGRALRDGINTHITVLTRLQAAAEAEVARLLAALQDTHTLLPETLANSDSSGRLEYITRHLGGYLATKETS